MKCKIVCAILCVAATTNSVGAIAYAENQLEINLPDMEVNFDKASKQISFSGKIGESPIVKIVFACDGSSPQIIMTYETSETERLSGHAVSIFFPKNGHAESIPVSVENVDGRTAIGWNADYLTVNEMSSILREREPVRLADGTNASSITLVLNATPKRWRVVNRELLYCRTN